MKEDWEALLGRVPDDALRREYARRFSVGRPPTLKPCPHCGQDFPSMQLRAHIPRCPARLAGDPAEIEKAKALLAYVEKKPKKVAVKRARKLRPGKLE